MLIQSVCSSPQPSWPSFDHEVDHEVCDHLLLGQSGSGGAGGASDVRAACAILHCPSGWLEAAETNIQGCHSRRCATNLDSDVGRRAAVLQAVQPLRGQH